MVLCSLLVCCTSDPLLPVSLQHSVHQETQHRQTSPPKSLPLLKTCVPHHRIAAVCPAPPADVRDIDGPRRDRVVQQIVDLAKEVAERRKVGN